MKKRKPNLAEVIANARKATGMTQEQAAEKAGYSRSMWINFEKGHRTPMKRSIPGIFQSLNLPLP
jgi:transcriptional regulator with XRE-family HTH domain